MCLSIVSSHLLPLTGVCCWRHRVNRSWYAHQATVDRASAVEVLVARGSSRLSAVEPRSSSLSSPRRRRNSSREREAAEAAKGPKSPPSPTTDGVRFIPLPSVFVFPNLLTVGLNILLTGLTEAAAALLAEQPEPIFCWPAYVVLGFVGLYVLVTLSVVLRFYYGGHRKELWVPARPQTVDEVHDPILRNVQRSTCRDCWRRLFNIIERYRGEM